MTASWLLLLSFVGYTPQGAALTTAGPFSTGALCELAGQAAASGLKTHPQDKVRYVCVKQSPRKFHGSQEP